MFIALAAALRRSQAFLLSFCLTRKPLFVFCSLNTRKKNNKITKRALFVQKWLLKDQVLLICGRIELFIIF